MIKPLFSAGAVRRRKVPSLRTFLLRQAWAACAAWPTVRLSCATERCGAAQRGHARDNIVCK